MKQTLYLLLYLLISPASLLAQGKTWHKLLPYPTHYSFSHYRLAEENGRFYVALRDGAIELTPRGEVVHYLLAEGQGLDATPFIKQYDPATGHPYFIGAGYSGSPTARSIVLGAYRPGEGKVHHIVLTDNVPVGTPAVPIIPLSDNRFLVFGRLYYRQVRYDLSAGFTEEWVRPITLTPSRVLLDGDRVIMAAMNGRLQALNAQGNSEWLRVHLIQFRAIRKVPGGGFIACGPESSDGDAKVIRLRADGTEIWSKKYPVNRFNDIVLTSDGGYAAVGQQSMGIEDIFLARLDSSGNLLWSRTYPIKAFPAAILEVSEGGYLIVGSGSGGLHVLRTDVQGNIAAEEPVRIRARMLANTALKIEMWPGSSHFTDGGGPTFWVRSDSLASTLCILNPWLGAYTATRQERLSISLPINDDFRPGTTAAPAADFDRVWLARRSELRALREDFLRNGALTEAPPLDVLFWPARGNPHLRYNLDYTPFKSNPNELPAPFVDANGDGHYDPYDGDLPAMKGDQMVWWCFTDNTQRPPGKGEPVGVDVHAIAYLVDCAPETTVEKTLFAEHAILNRSGTSYSKTHLGYLTDFAIGCERDDYIGTLPHLNTWYAYNGTPFDSNCGKKGFGSRIPVQTAYLLNHSLDHAWYYSSLIIPDLTPLGYMQQINGSIPITRGGTGYEGASNDTLRHVFPDNPADPQGWTMCSANLAPSHFRMVAAHGPFALSAGDTFLVQLAFTAFSDVPLPCPDIFGQVAPGLAQMQQWHAADALDLNAVPLEPVYMLAPGQTLVLNAARPGATYAWSTGSSAPTLSVASAGTYTVTLTNAAGCTKVLQTEVLSSVGAPELAPELPWHVWPNPATQEVWVSCADCGSGRAEVALYDAQGRCVRSPQRVSLPARIEVVDLPPGLYALWLQSGGSAPQMRRLAIMRQR